MSGPWEKFKASTTPESAAGPWTKFKSSAASTTPSGGMPTAESLPANKTMVGPEAGGQPLPAPLAVAEKMAEGYTFGAAPKISAAMGAGMQQLLPENKESFGDAYEAIKAKTKKDLSAFGERNPITSAALETAGVVANPVTRMLPSAKIKDALTVGGFLKNAAGGALGAGLFAAGGSEGSLKERAKQIASDTTKGAVLGGLVPIPLKGLQGAGKIVAKGLDLAKSELSDEAKIAAKELQAQGIDVSYMTKIPQVAKGIVRGYFANTVFGGIPVKAASRQVKEQVGQAFDTQLAKVGDAVTAAGAGEMIHGAVDEAKNAFKRASNQLYDIADEHLVPANGLPVEVRIENTSKFLNSKNTALEGLSLQKILGDPDTEKLSADISAGLLEAQQKGRLSYPTLKAIRTAVGEQIDDTPFGGEKQKYWKRLYGSLSDDMVAAAKAAGPEAYEASVAANDFYKKGRAEIEKIVARYGSKVEVEKVFNKIADPSALTRQPKMVMDLLDKLPPESRKIVGATVIKRMGQTSDEVDMNLNAWQRKWEKLSPSMKSALAGNPQVAEQLNMLSRNITRVAPLVNDVAETGFQAAGKSSDFLAAASLLHPVNWPYALAKISFDMAGGWLLTKPQNLKELNEVIASGDKVKGASFLRKAAEWALDDEHKQMALQAADFLIRNRAGVIGMSAPAVPNMGLGSNLGMGQ